jgi:hypothetical protein
MLLHPRRPIGFRPVRPERDFAGEKKPIGCPFHELLAV